MDGFKLGVVVFFRALFAIGTITRAANKNAAATASMCRLQFHKIAGNQQLYGNDGDSGIGPVINRKDLT